MATEQHDARGEARQTFYARQQMLADAKGVFQQLSGIMRSASLYPPGHPFLQTSADQLLEKIDGLGHSRKNVAFYIVGGELFFETHAVPIDQSVSLLMEAIAKRDIGGIVFKPGLDRDEVLTFVDLLGRDYAASGTEWGIGAEMTAARIVHIELHRVVVVDKKAGDAGKEAKRRSTAVFMDAVHSVEDVVESVSAGRSVNMRAMNTMVHSMVDNILENRDALLGLTSIKMYDAYTFAHSVNTAVLAISLATYLSLEKPQIAAVGIAALLHDIGKVKVPRDIINKPSKLSDDEWNVLQRHPVDGALILANVPAITKLALIAAFEHHQHGIRGYPHIDDRVQQHPFSQIIALADAYDAITAARVYYSVQTPPDKAVRILLTKRGTVFSPVLVKAFVNMVGIYPIGTLLKLDDGRIGLVTHQTRDLLRPRVLILERFDGSEREQGVEVNLLETEEGRYKRSAVGVLDPYVAGIDVKQYLA